MKTNSSLIRGNQLLRSGKLEDAVAAYKNVVLFYPNFHWGYYKLGEALEQLELWEEAAKAYNHAFDLSPELFEKSIESLIKHTIKIAKLRGTIPSHSKKNSHLLKKNIKKIINFVEYKLINSYSFPSNYRHPKIESLFELYEIITKGNDFISEAFELYRLIVPLQSIGGLVDFAKTDSSYLSKITKEPFVKVINKNFYRPNLSLDQLFSFLVNQELLSWKSRQIALTLLKEVAEFPTSSLFTTLLGTVRNKNSCLMNPNQVIAEKLNNITPSNNHESRNLHRLQSNSTFWCDIFLSEQMCIPLIKNDQLCQLIYPIATIFMRRKKTVFLYPFLIGPIVIAPLFSGWMLSPFKGFALLDLNSNTLIFFCRPSVVAGIERKLAKSLVQVLIQSKTCLAAPKFSTLLGCRVNYGHTIINETSCLDLLQYKSAYGKTPRVLIGNDDYLDTFSLVSSLGCKIEFLSQFQCNDLDSYMLPNHIACPLTTYRPTTKALSLIRRGNFFRSEKNPKALYFAVDYRTGARRFVNITDVLSILVELALQHNLYLLIDGLTNIDFQSGKAKSNKFLHQAVKNILTEKTLQDFLEGKSDNEIYKKLIVADGLTFPEKIEIFSQYYIKAAFTPYGSSAILPIYVLNVPIYIFGTESRPKFERQRWHITRYCHKERLFPENIIKSSKVSNDGYEVMLSDLKNKLKEVLSYF